MTSSESSGCREAAFVPGTGSTNCLKRGTTMDKDEPLQSPEDEDIQRYLRRLLAHYRPAPKSKNKKDKEDNKGDRDNQDE
jgi:hypothetical protein